MSGLADAANASRSALRGQATALRETAAKELAVAEAKLREEAEQQLRGVVDESRERAVAAVAGESAASLARLRARGRRRSRRCASASPGQGKSVREAVSQATKTGCGTLREEAGRLRAAQAKDFEDRRREHLEAAEETLSRLGEQAKAAESGLAATADATRSALREEAEAAARQRARASSRLPTHKMGEDAERQLQDAAARNLEETMAAAAGGRRAKRGRDRGHRAAGPRAASSSRRSPRSTRTRSRCVARLTSQFEACLEALRKEADERAKALATQQREALEALSLAVLDHNRAVVAGRRIPRSVTATGPAGRSERRRPRSRPALPSPSGGDRAPAAGRSPPRPARPRPTWPRRPSRVRTCPRTASTDVDRLLDDLVHDVRVIGEPAERRRQRVGKGSAAPPHSNFSPSPAAPENLQAARRGPDPSPTRPALRPEPEAADRPRGVSEGGGTPRTACTRRPAPERATAEELSEGGAPAPSPPRYSVEMLGSAWTLWGTTIRKFSVRVGGQARGSRSASSSWSVARSSSA